MKDHGKSKAKLIDELAELRARTAELEARQEEYERAEQALQESEEKFRNITEQSLMAIVILQDDRIKYANEAAARALEYSVEEILSWDAKGWLRFVHPDDLFFVAEQAIKQQAGDEDLVTSHQWRIVTKTGETRWIEAYATTILYEGKTCGLTAAVDITERKRTEEALRDSERLLADLIEFLPDPTGAIDKEGKVIAWNRAMAELLGVSAEDMLGKGNYEYALSSFGERRPILVDMVSRPDEEIRKYYPNFRRDGDKISNENYLPDFRGGTYLWAKAAPLYNASGEVIGAIQTVRDTTAQKRVEQELARHRDRLEELVKEKTDELEAAQEELLRRERLAVLGQLTATVSHELRNPLSVIRSSAFVLNNRMGLADEKVAKHLARIEEQVDACDSIVGDLLEFTRGRHPQPKAGEINPWLEDVLDTIPIPKDIELIRCLAPDLPPVLLDQEMMRRVVVNLIENAIDAVVARQEADKTGDGAYKPVLRILSQETEEGVRFEVEDNGIGMDEETAKRAFEPLFTTRARGTGLGLAIVQRIVEEHGGTVSIESNTPRGTKLSVVLPKER